MSRRGHPAAFIDKDGTLLVDVPYNVDPEHVRFTPNAIEGLQALRSAGFLLVVVTNQPGIALGRFDVRALHRLQQSLERRLADAGVPLAGFHACPHAPDSRGDPACACRKPEAGLFRQAAAALDLDLVSSWMVGDILDDVEAGHRAGCRSVLLDVGHETVWRPGPLRVPDLRASDLLDAARQITAHTTARAGRRRAEGIPS